MRNDISCIKNDRYRSGSSGRILQIDGKVKKILVDDQAKDWERIEFRSHAPSHSISEVSLGPDLPGRNGNSY
jgi:hypothetical protein